jgi:hypothetical protein
MRTSEWHTNQPRASSLFRKTGGTESQENWQPKEAMTMAEKKASGTISRDQDQLNTGWF